MLRHKEIAAIAKKCCYHKTVDPSIYRYSEELGIATAFIERDKVRVRAMSNPPGMKALYIGDATTEDELLTHMLKARDIIDKIGKEEE